MKNKTFAELELDTHYKKKRVGAANLDLRNFVVAILIGFLLWGLIILGFLSVSSRSEAGEIPDDMAVHCVMGEARGEGYTGMLMCAGALRNRGTTQGVYGCRARINEPERIWKMAWKAWHESAIKDISNGADYWGSLIVDKKWIAKMVKNGFIEVARHKNQVYFKKVRK